MIFLVLLSMIFCHIVDDFYLQGCLAQMKQRSWWTHNISMSQYSLYKNDYKMALAVHGFSWSFMAHLPLTVYIYFTNYPALIFLPISYILNAIIHALIDNLKANEHSLNLIWDQICHLTQIVSVWIIFAILIV